MGRAGITLHEVSDAAVQLQGRGKNPTVDGVRAILGTGSKSTIAQHLREWRSQQQETTGALPTELLAVVTGLWERLNLQTEQQIESYTRGSIAEIKGLKEAITQLQRAQQALQTQLHQQEEMTAMLQAAKVSVEIALLQEQQAHGKLQERYQGVVTQLEDAKAENSRLHKLATHIQANLEHYQESVHRLRSEQALEAEKQQVAFQQERGALQQQFFVQQQRAQELETQLQLKEQALQTAETVKIEHEKQLQKHQENTRELIVYTERCKQLQKKQQEQSVELSQKMAAISELEKKQAALMERTEHLEKSLASAEDKIEALRSEKLFLIQEKAELQGYIQQLQK